MSDYLPAIAEQLDNDPDDAQWALDHPDGEISDEEALAMAEYASEGRDRDEECHPRGPEREI